MNPAFSLFDILARRADLGPERIALVDLGRNEQLSYQQLHQRTGRTASLLATLGVTAGERVAVLCRNCIEFFELLFACARIGVVLVPLNWRMPAAELGPLMADCGAPLILYGREDAATAEELRVDGASRLGLDDAGPQGYAARRDALAPVAGRGGWQSDETWYLLYKVGS